MQDYGITATFLVKIKNFDYQVQKLYAMIATKYKHAKLTHTSEDNIKTRELKFGYLITIGKPDLMSVFSAKKLKHGFMAYDYNIYIFQNGEATLRIAPRKFPKALQDQKDICDIINSAFPDD